jgi:hypothetical protein
MSKLSPRPRTAVTGDDKTPQPPTGGITMARISDHVLGDHPQRARRDLATSWDHLLSAAGHGAKHVGQSSRRRAEVARDRAETARLVLLGQLPPSPWRWLGIGLAAGLAIGAAGATVLARARRGADQTATDEANATVSAAPSKVREKAVAGAEKARARTRAAVQRATTSARGAAVEFRDRLTIRDSTGEPEPTDSAPPPPVTVPGR